jgi:hypothetical protein
VSHTVEKYAIDISEIGVLKTVDVGVGSTYPEDHGYLFPQYYDGTTLWGAEARVDNATPYVAKYKILELGDPLPEDDYDDTWECKFLTACGDLNLVLCWRSPTYH